MTSPPNKGAAAAGSETAQAAESAGGEIRNLVASLPARSVARATPHNLPPKQLFVGRRDELKLVDEALARDGRSSIAQAAVWGLGGVGKSALALKYAYDALGAGTYPGGIFWVLAEGGPLNAMGRLAGILREYAPGLLPYIPEQTPPAKVAEVVRRTLEDLPVLSLVILDNVSDKGFADVLPGKNARVLMTLRDRRLAIGKPIALDVLSQDDARKLAVDLAEKEPNNKEEEDAFGRVLDAQLGGLAVAVEVAARAVKEWARSWVEYEKLLATQLMETLDAPEDRSPNYDRGVFAALDMSIDRCSEIARRLLEGAAVFAPDAVPLDWAHAAAGLDAKNIPVLRALGDLKALALVKEDEKAGMLSMHRLVHQGVRDRADTESWRASVKRAALVVENWTSAAVGPSGEQMDAVQKRREHIEEVLKAAEGVGNTRELCEIADRLATHLQHRGELEEARRLFELSLANAEKVYGPEHAQVAASLANLGGALNELGELEQARSCFERALAMGKKAYGLEHLIVGIRESSLAVTLRRLKKPTEARPMAEHALAIFLREYGPGHREVAIRQANLAILLHDLGKLHEARALLEEALATDEREHGAEHPHVAADLTSLALVLKDLGETATALHSAERAVAIAERVWSPTHPRAVAFRKNLAAIRKAYGERHSPESREARGPKVRKIAAVAAVMLAGAAAIVGLVGMTLLPCNSVPRPALSGSPSLLTAATGIDTQGPVASARPNSNCSAMLPTFKDGAAELRVATIRGDRKAAMSRAADFRALLKKFGAVDWISHVSEPVGATFDGRPAQLVLVHGVLPGASSEFCDWVRCIGWSTGLQPCELRSVEGKDIQTHKHTPSALPTSVQPVPPPLCVTEQGESYGDTDRSPGGGTIRVEKACLPPYPVLSDCRHEEHGMNGGHIDGSHVEGNKCICTGSFPEKTLFGPGQSAGCRVFATCCDR